MDEQFIDVVIEAVIAFYSDKRKGEENGENHGNNRVRKQDD